MDLHLSLDAPDRAGTPVGATGDLAARIYHRVLEAVHDGRLAPGERVPPTRELALQLGVSRGTVTTAYDRLVAEGFLQTRVGAGTFVTRAPTAPRPARPPGARGAPGVPGAEDRVREVWARLPAPVHDPPPMEFDFTVGGPDTSLFPLAVWRRLVSATLRPSLLAASAYDGGGNPALQAQIARYAARSRSVVAGPADVLLTNGAQQGLDLVARALLDPGDVVAVESPGYTAAVRLFASHGARVVGVAVDGEGLVVDDLPASAKLVYVTPSHQFPTGAVMSLRRRIALLEWASRRNAVVVEDDYDSEFRFENRPLAPLQNMDREGRVVYVGSFSKILMPSLRVGYLVAPPSLQPSLRQAKLLTDWQGDAVTQGALARFMEEGQLASHLRRVTRTYTTRRTALLDALRGLPDGLLEVQPSAAGLHVCAWLGDRGADDLAVVRAAADRGVAVEPVSVRHHGTPARPGLALGFRRVPVESVGAAVARLGDALTTGRTAGVPRSSAPKRWVSPQ